MLLFLVEVPGFLSFGPWADLTLLCITIFDLMDFLATKLLLPAGAIGMALFVGWVFWPEAAKSLNACGQPPPRCPPLSGAGCALSLHRLWYFG
jgi:NSS family neurotransmitter:Na+ symporter